MKAPPHFTWADLETQYSTAKELGYEFITCADYVERKNDLPALTCVNRVDIDLSVKKADRLRDIFDRLGIKASLFVRLHATEYNPFAFENYRILKSIRGSGHEIEYHSEVVDQAAIWNEDAAECLLRELDVLNRMLNVQAVEVASHGGMTGLNNLKFWEDRKASDFGLIYEAYDKSESFNLFDRSFYVSDSEWTQWKCYEKGRLKVGDRRSFGEHVLEQHPLIYLLTHPDTYFDRHFYE
jgi:hypothetical protein